MAELHFFATEEDHEALVSLLVMRFRGRFVLDGSATREMPTFTTVAEVMHVIESESYDPRFFVLSPLWQLEPLSVVQIEHDDGRIRYYIRQREGGPAFDYLARRPRSAESGAELVSSWFGHHPSYWSGLKKDAQFARPVEMTNAYAEVVRHISRGGKRTDVTEIKRTGPWARPGAIAAHERGTWLRVGEWHHSPRTRKLTRRSTGPAQRAAQVG